MTVVPRHVAYILSRLEPQEQDQVPWYRVVGESGKLGKNKLNFWGQSQAELLEAESVLVGKGVVMEFERFFISVAALNCGVEPGKNYLT